MIHGIVPVQGQEREGERLHCSLHCVCKMRHAVRNMKALGIAAVSRAITVRYACFEGLDRAGKGLPTMQELEQYQPCQEHEGVTLVFGGMFVPADTPDNLCELAKEKGVQWTMSGYQYCWSYPTINSEAIEICELTPAELGITEEEKRWKEDEVAAYIKDLNESLEEEKGAGA